MPAAKSAAHVVWSGLSIPNTTAINSDAFEAGFFDSLRMFVTLDTGTFTTVTLNLQTSDDLGSTWMNCYDANSTPMQTAFAADFTGTYVFGCSEVAGAALGSLGLLSGPLLRARVVAAGSNIVAGSISLAVLPFCPNRVPTNR